MREEEEEVLERRMGPVGIFSSKFGLHGPGEKRERAVVARNPVFLPPHAQGASGPP